MLSANHDAVVISEVPSGNYRFLCINYVIFKHDTEDGKLEWCKGSYGVGNSNTHFESIMWFLRIH